MHTYRATNTINGKFYIGSTFDFPKRKKDHLSSKDDYPFQRSLRKNPDAFEWEVWEDNSEDPILEQALLDMFFGTEQCYNLNPKANRPPSWRGKKQSAEHIRKRTEHRKGKPGKPLSETAKQKVSEFNKGKKVSNETRRKTSESLKGKPKSKEHIRNLQKARGYPVIITYSNGREEEFISIAEAAQVTKIPKTTLKRCFKTGKLIKRGLGEGVQIRPA